MKRCKTCVLPETYPEIQFDEAGICNQCHNYTPVQYKGEDALKEIFANTISGSKWDCLVPLSGGRDSTFTLHQLVRKYKKRVLVYNYDNGFVEPVAKDNIQHITNTLGVDIVYRKSKNDIQCQNIKWLTKQNIKKSPAHVVTYLCSGCRNGIWGGAFAVAKEHKIPLIVFGESTMESGGFKKYFASQCTPNLPEKLRFMIQMPYNTLRRKQVEKKLFQEFPLFESAKEIKKINFFDYEEWDENTILSTIRKELDWQAKEGQSSWRFDCQIHALVNAMTYSLLGMTEKDELYSKLIREKKLTREEALKKLSRNEAEISLELHIAEKVVNRLKLNNNESNKILKFCTGPSKLKNSWTY